MIFSWNVKNNRLYTVWDLLCLVFIDSGSSMVRFFRREDRKDYSNNDHCRGNNILP